MSRYFDHAATTPVDPAVIREMLPFFGDDFGNAHSIHQYGRAAEAAVELARSRVAELVGCAPEEIAFTSGATEANNWVLSAFVDAAVSPVEHSSLWETAQATGKRIYDGTEPDLLAWMMVNNETGQILGEPPAHRQLLRDATQAVGKLDLPLDGDFVTFSAHKFYGPKGVGALYARDALFPTPLLRGGGQEHGHRAGTLNVPGIVGMGVAAAIAGERRADDELHARALRAAVLGALENVTEFTVHADDSPFILSLGFRDVYGAPLVIELDRAGFGVSSASACSSGSDEPSHVLIGMGIDPAWARGTVRISFGRGNRLEDAEALGKALAGIVERLRALK